jgi:hypothetical protein
MVNRAATRCNPHQPCAVNLNWSTARAAVLRTRPPL